MEKKFEKHLKEMVEVDKQVRGLEKEMHLKSKEKENDQEIIKNLS